MKKIIVVYLLDLLEERGEKGQCDLVCVCGGSLDDWAIAMGLVLVMLMSYSRVVRLIFVLWGVGPILRNGSN